MSKEDVFENYKDLNDLTKKTADEHIEFYKNKESLSITELFEVWKKLSKQAENFDERNWTENWHNWEKHYHAFEKHKLEGKYMIQHYLTNVLEELIAKLIKNFESDISMIKEKTKPQKETNDISELIRQEVKHQIKLQLNKKKRKSK